MSKGRHLVRHYLGSSDFYETFFFGSFLSNGSKSPGHNGSKHNGTNNHRVPYKFVEDSFFHGKNPDVTIVKVKIYDSDFVSISETREVCLSRHLDDVVFDISKKHET